MILRSSKQTSPHIILQISEKTTKKKAPKKKHQKNRLYYHLKKRLKIRKKNRLID